MASNFPLQKTTIITPSLEIPRGLSPGYSLKEQKELIERSATLIGVRLDYGLRYWPNSRFPFVVFYDVREFEILFLGVMHTAQVLMLTKQIEKSLSDIIRKTSSNATRHRSPCLVWSVTGNKADCNSDRPNRRL